LIPAPVICQVSGSVDEVAALVAFVTWSATVGNGGTVFGGTWDAAAGDDADTISGNWTLMDKSGATLADGTWAAHKDQNVWRGIWKARNRSGRLYSGTWRAHSELPASARFSGLFETIIPVFAIPQHPGYSSGHACERHYALRGGGVSHLESALLRNNFRTGILGPHWRLRKRWKRLTAMQIS
jgi:hypothetical protein